MSYAKFHPIGELKTPLLSCADSDASLLLAGSKSDGMFAFPGSLALVLRDQYPELSKSAGSLGQ
ncbi:MAG: hypothetical protein ACE5EH_09115 [Gammaproteobacteria bacterium]